MGSISLRTELWLMHFIWALLLRIESVPNYKRGVNRKVTELKIKNCEMENFVREALKVLLQPNIHHGDTEARKKAKRRLPLIFADQTWDQKEA